MLQGATAALGLALLGCTPTPPPPVSWPAGTVLALNGEAIAADQVDDVGAIFVLVDPLSAVEQARRLALTNIVFPRVISTQLGGARRAEQRALADSFKLRLDRGDEPAVVELGPWKRRLEGSFNEVGLEAWAWALAARPGAWSDVQETIGAFQLVQLEKREDSPVPARVHMVVNVYVFHYLDENDVRDAVNRELDRSKLEFVDPTWRDVVPTTWQYRLRGESP